MVCIQGYVFSGAILPIVLGLILLAGLSYNKNRSLSIYLGKRLVASIVVAIILFFFIGWVCEIGWSLVSWILAFVPILVYLYIFYNIVSNDKCTITAISMLNECTGKLAKLGS